MEFSFLVEYVFSLFFDFEDLILMYLISILVINKIRCNSLKTINRVEIVEELRR